VADCSFFTAPVQTAKSVAQLETATWMRGLVQFFSISDALTRPLSVAEIRLIIDCLVRVLVDESVWLGRRSSFTRRAWVMLIVSFSIYKRSTDEYGRRTGNRVRSCARLSKGARIKSAAGRYDQGELHGLCRRRNDIDTSLRSPEEIQLLALTQLKSAAACGLPDQAKAELGFRQFPRRIATRASATEKQSYLMR